MNVLVVDVGGTHVKILATGQKEHREFVSGPTMTPIEMVAGVLRAAEGWEYDVVSIGYPGPVLRGKPVSEPHNLGPGWVGFDFESAFKHPVKVINDAAMQALGSYRGGRMLFLGLGTGLGSAMIVDGILEPMELGHLPYKKGTFEDYVGIRGLDRVGRKKWRKHVDRRGGAARRRDAGRRSRPGGRQRQKAERAAATLPRGGQRQRLRGRASACGNKAQPDATSAHATAPTAGPGWGTKTEPAPCGSLTHHSPPGTGHFFFEERHANRRFSPMRRRRPGAEPSLIAAEARPRSRPAADSCWPPAAAKIRGKCFAPWRTKKFPGRRSTSSRWTNASPRTATRIATSRTFVKACWDTHRYGRSKSTRCP